MFAINKELINQLKNGDVVDKEEYKVWTLYTLLKMLECSPMANKVTTKINESELINMSTSTTLNNNNLQSLSSQSPSSSPPLPLPPLNKQQMINELYDHEWVIPRLIYFVESGQSVWKPSFYLLYMITIYSDNLPYRTRIIRSGVIQQFIKILNHTLKKNNTDDNDDVHILITLYGLLHLVSVDPYYIDNFDEMNKEDKENKENKRKKLIDMSLIVEGQENVFYYLPLPPKQQLPTVTTTSSTKKDRLMETLSLNTITNHALRSLIYEFDIETALVNLFMPLISINKNVNKNQNQQQSQLISKCLPKHQHKIACKLLHILLIYRMDVENKAPNTNVYCLMINLLTVFNNVNNNNKRTRFSYNNAKQINDIIISIQHSALEVLIKSLTRLDKELKWFMVYSNDLLESLIQLLTIYYNEVNQKKLKTWRQFYVQVCNVLHTLCSEPTSSLISHPLPSINKNNPYCLKKLIIDSNILLLLVRSMKLAASYELDFESCCSNVINDFTTNNNDSDQLRYVISILNNEKMKN